MKKELTLCSLALNPNSTDPAATMIRVSDGRMLAYGGVFCISVPYPMEIGCCFSPTVVGSFFRKERDKIAFTLKGGKLVISEGKERLTVKALPPEELAIIDNFEMPVPATVNIPLLKMAAEVTNVEGPTFAHGVIFKDGSMSSTNNKVFFCGESGLPDDMDFAISKESCIALTKFKSPVVSVAYNSQTVKFIFEDGSSLCARQLLCSFPNISPLFAGEWTALELTEDLSKIQCEYMKLSAGAVYYHEADNVGLLENVLNSKIEVAVNKKHFDFLTKLGNNISLSEDKNKLKSVGENCVVISTLRIPE